MRLNAKIGLMILILLGAFIPVHGLGVPGDLNGDKVVSGDELKNAEEMQKGGKISPAQLDPELPIF